MRNPRIVNIVTFTVIGIVVSLGLVGSAAMAQTKSVGEKVGHQLAFAGSHRLLANKLGLSEKQQAQIKEIRQQARERAKAIWANDNQTVAALKNGLKTLREDTKNKIAAVLTPEQKAKLEKAHNQFKGRGAGKSTPPPGV